jgi:hypothetical protein
MELINGSAADATRDNADKVNQFSGRVSEEVLRIDTECYRRIFQAITRYASLPKTERRNPVFDRARTRFRRLFGLRDMPTGRR